MTETGPTVPPAPSGTPDPEPTTSPGPSEAPTDPVEEPLPPEIVPRPIPAFPTTPNRHGWIVGDSITVQSAPNFRKRFHKFDHTALSGLRVQELPRIVEARIAHGRLPSYVVIALGTNQADTWSVDPMGSYRAVIDSIHAASPRTRVVLVTTYRDPKRSDLYTFGDDVTMATYSAAMVALAAQDPRICVSSWRWWIARNPHHLYDGVHPSFPGRKKWAELLRSAIHDRC